MDLNFSSYGIPDDPFVGNNVGLGNALSRFGAPETTMPALPTTVGNVDSYIKDSGILGSVNDAIGFDAGKSAVEKPGFWGSDGFNIGDVGSIASMLGGFGQLYLGYQANKMAKDSFEFQKQAYQKNMANQIKSYNLALEDRMSARYAQNNRTQEEADQKIKEHKL